MTEKLYASQWVKIKEEKDRIAAMSQLGDEELKLLFDMSRNAAQFKDMDLEPAELAALAVEALGVKKVMEILTSQKDGHTMLSMINVIEYQKKGSASQIADEICTFAVKERDYPTLLLLGRKIYAYFPDILDRYVCSILPLLKEYKYGKGSPANPITCLAFLSLKIEMKVEKYLKENDLKDAIRRWKEYHDSRRRE